MNCIIVPHGNSLPEIQLPPSKSQCQISIAPLSPYCLEWRNYQKKDVRQQPLNETGINKATEMET